MKYTCTFDVNSHDQDVFGRIRPSAVIRYMQECANLQLHDTGFSYNDLFENGLAFILSRINVSVYKDFHPHEKITAQSWLSDCHGVVFTRLYKLFSGEELAAEGASVWGLIGVQDKRIHRVTEIDTSVHYDPDTVGIDIPRRTVKREADFKLCGERTVYYADCDINGHMNNTNYADMLLSFAPEFKRSAGKSVASMNISYLSEAKLGEEIKIYTAESDGARLFRTVREDGRINAEAEFILE